MKIDPNLLNLGAPEFASLGRDQAKSIILQGKGKMPAFQKTIKPEDVDPLVDYVMWLKSSAAGIN
jgi:mono/diheme cytochrome c family protein